jgi:uncharacterized protein
LSGQLVSFRSFLFGLKVLPSQYTSRGAIYTPVMRQDNTPRRLVIAGGAGFLGRGLVRHIGSSFDEIVILSRSPGPVSGRVRPVLWDACTSGDWVRELDGAAAVVNYVGRTVDCVKTPARRREIIASRVDSVTALGRAIRQVSHPPPAWVQAGTAHIFGDTQDELLDESSPVGTGFAPEVGTAWERAFTDACPPAVRAVLLRISFVLGPDGGALRTLARLARFGLGGTVGSGRQWMSWLHERDLARMVHRAIDGGGMTGIYVATAPNPVRNAEFMRELRRAVRRPWSPPVPALCVRVGAALLRTDPELALLGRRCVPTRLEREGFVFDFPTLPAALADAVTPAASAG